MKVKFKSYSISKGQVNKKKQFAVDKLEYEGRFPNFLRESNALFD